MDVAVRILAQMRRDGPGRLSLSSNTYASTAARVQALVEQGGGCRATFFNYRRRLAGGKGTGERISP
jgi:hypothetical protein